MSIEFAVRIIGMVVFSIAGVSFGVNLSDLTGGEPTLSAVVFGLVGALVGIILTPIISVRPIRAVRATLTRVSAKTLFAGIVGLVIGLIIAGLVAFPLSLLPEPYSQILPIGVAMITSYFGIVIFVSRQNDIFYMWRSLGQGRDQGAGGLDAPSTNGRMVLIDTSVIIDGRIVDIAKTGFIPGELVIPRFVLNELQHIADSADTLRRQRGRRGLEVLSQMQKNTVSPVRISDIDVEGSKEVDDKLVILARQMRVPVLTNDYNLNRVAELQGVKILNINDLANAVKSILLPGENLTIRVIQDGREPGQGIGYLEDGTMVVVQDGNEHIGSEVKTVVTKVLQTAAGRMIFSRLIEK